MRIEAFPRTTSGPDRDRLQDANYAMVSQRPGEAQAAFTKCTDLAAATLAG